MSAPPLFRGRAQAGAVIELRPSPDGGYDILADGARADHNEAPWQVAPDLIEPFQIGDWTCREIFAAPDEAVAALRAFLARPRASPPWSWARELYEDGLTNADFALTPRGARRLFEPQAPERTGGERVNYCVLLASATRARVLTLASATPVMEPTLARLEEVADTADPERRARDSEWFSDTRPGLRRECQAGPRHGVSDRREGHRHEEERRFAELVAGEAAQISSRFRTCLIVVVASPETMGVIRPMIARRIGVTSRYEMVEHAGDLTHLSAPAVHDALARAGILPRPGRRPPVRFERPARGG